jgi:hypothetical protein
MRWDAPTLNTSHGWASGDCPQAPLLFEGLKPPRYWRTRLNEEIQLDVTIIIPEEYEKNDEKRQSASSTA